MNNLKFKIATKVAKWINKILNFQNDVSISSNINVPIYAAITFLATALATSVTKSEFVQFLNPGGNCEYYK